LVHLWIQYQARRPDLPAVEHAVKVFVEAVAKHEPRTVYEAYQSADGLTFFHVMAFPDEAARNEHQGAAYTRAFVELLYPRCEVSPKFTQGRLLASTRGAAGSANR
jgi:quinol monooxygenase YgiN